jgi:hypothetical protein
MFTKPAVHDVGVDAVTQGNAGNRGTLGLALCDDLRFEFGAVEAPCPVPGVRLASHGVHDLHRAHDARLHGPAQDGFTARLPSNEPRADAWEPITPKTQSAYIRSVGKLARFIGRSPDTASAEDLRRFQLHLVDEGTSPINLNATIVGLNFLFAVTLGRPEAMAKMQSVRVPHKLPVVLSKEEFARLLGAVGHIKHQTALSLSALKSVCIAWPTTCGGSCVSWASQR